MIIKIIQQGWLVLVLTGLAVAPLGVAAGDDDKEGRWRGDDGWYGNYGYGQGQNVSWHWGDWRNNDWRNDDWKWRYGYGNWWSPYYGNHQGNWHPWYAKRQYGNNRYDRVNWHGYKQPWMPWGQGQNPWSGWNGWGNVWAGW